MQFTELVSPELAALLEARGILEATPIQEQTLPHTLEGRDLIGRARTGTGKTLAFALPILSKLTPSRDRGRGPRAIIMLPPANSPSRSARSSPRVAPRSRC